MSDKIKKILVVYYSLSGNTEKTAKGIANILNADIEKIIDKKKRSGVLNYLFAGRDAMKKKTTEINTPEKDPANYDLIIIGDPVWAWTMTPAARTYIEKFKNKFKNIAVFITSGNTSIEKIIPEFEKLIEKKTIAKTGFISKEIKDAKLYSEKLNNFIADIKANI